MLASARPLALLLPLLACSVDGLREASRRHMPAAFTIPKYRTGEFMEYEVLEGSEAGNWVKCSITGPGDIPDTYNVYVWSAEKSKRNLKNIPVEVLRTQAEQEAKRKAIEDEKRRIREEEEARRRAKEAEERRVREAEEARLRAIQEAERKAREEEEAKRKAEEDARRLVEEAEAKRKAEEEERLRIEREAREKVEREEAARQRKIYLKARWEEVKAAKLKADLDAMAKEEEEEKAWLADRAARVARGEKITTTPPPLADPENIRVILRLEGKPDLSLKVRRNLRLRALMGVATQKMGLEADGARFLVGKRVLAPEETAERFGPHDKVVVHMEPISPHERASLRLVAERTGTSVGSFEAGDFAQANVSDGHGGVVAVPCAVRAKGTLPDSFDVHFMFSAGSRQDIVNVPAKLLQKVRGKQYAAAVKAFRDDPDAAATAVQRMVRSVEDATHMRQRAPAARRPEPATMAPPVEEPAEPEAADEAPEPLAVGNLAEFTLKDGSQVPAAVTAVKGEPPSYDLHVIFAGAPEQRGLRDLRSVPGRQLRRLRAKPYVEAVQRLKQEPMEAQRLLEQAARELGAS